MGADSQAVAGSILYFPRKVMKKIRVHPRESAANAVCYLCFCETALFHFKRYVPELARPLYLRHHGIKRPQTVHDCFQVRN